MELILPDLREGYVNVLENVLRAGVAVTSRGLATRELTGIQLIFPDTVAPLLPVGVGRRINQRLAAIEALTIIGGVARDDLLTLASPRYARVLVDPGNPSYGAYGPRLVTQLVECLTLLDEEPTTRRAVATIWREEDLTHDGDRPCTIFLQFLVRPSVDEPTRGEQALELYVTMRSQDAWLGVPYDVFAFSQLQLTVARELQLPPGRYVHRVTSLHLYETNLEAAEAIVAAYHADPNLPPCDDLPLGVTSIDPVESGFTVATYLLDEVGDRPRTLSEHERVANRWYVEQLKRLEHS